MSLNSIRRLRKALNETIDYSPEENAPQQYCESAERSALKAQDRLEELAPIFALLDAVDALTAKVNIMTEILVKAYAHYIPECGGDFVPNDCREACGDFFTCKRSFELASLAQTLKDLEHAKQTCQ